jgi:hypothetical protein
MTLKVFLYVITLLVYDVRLEKEQYSSVFFSNLPSQFLPFLVGIIVDELKVDLKKSLKSYIARVILSFRCCPKRKHFLVSLR